MNQNQDYGSLSASGKLANLRNGRTVIQQKVLDEIWQEFVQTHAWPNARGLHNRHGTKAVREALRKLGGCVVREENNERGQSTYHLSLLGALITSEGQRIQKLLARFFQLQRDFFERAPEKQESTLPEIASKLGLAEGELALLGKSIRIGVFANSSWGGPDGVWAVGCMKEAEDFPTTGDLMEQVEQWALRGYEVNVSVYHSDRFTGGTAILGTEPSNTRPENATPNSDGDPLKRRYQVFVSSTFSDLAEERKHVMEALLRTKCIPSGMELFPAASTAQWDLIKRVIDDCDYYVVIVAGKYGSVALDGISYTEKEFDYAVSKGKSVLGFYHSDIRKLSGEKLEDTDSARSKLAKFTAKVKSRLCQAWNTPEGLASAIKSAIINAIETDPKPGWVRADQAPSWGLVHSLRERIAELEGRPAGQSEPKFPAGDEKIEIRARIHWGETDAPKRRWSSTSKSKEHTFALGWDELLLMLGLKPGFATSRHGLYRAFTHNLAKRLEPEIKHNNLKHVTHLGGWIDGPLFDRVLQTLLARKLLKLKLPPRGITKKAMYWQLSPVAIQRLAELSALRHAP